MKIVTSADSAARASWDKLSRQARCMHIMPIAMALLSTERLHDNQKKDAEMRRDIARQMVLFALLQAMPTFDDFTEMASQAAHSLDWTGKFHLGDFLDAMSQKKRVTADDLIK